MRSLSRVTVGLAVALAIACPPSPTAALAQDRVTEPTGESGDSGADSNARDHGDGNDGAPAAPTSDQPGTLRLEDDLDDLGADVSFDDVDDGGESVTVDIPLAQDAGANGLADAADVGNRRIETVIMAFTRLRADVVHDGATPAPAGAAPTGEQVFAFRGHARADVTARLGKRVKLKLAGRANADLGYDASSDLALRRAEAWVWDTHADFYTDHIDVRIGNHIVGWGVADLLSPNDVVNPRDLRRGFAERPSDLRIPVLALNTTAYAGPLSFQLLYVPFTPGNRFELLDGDYAVLGPGAPSPVERQIGSVIRTLADAPTTRPALGPVLDIDDGPRRRLRDGEVGGSISVRSDDVDVHAYAFWGHDRMPALAVAPALGAVFMDTPPAQLDVAVVAAEVQRLATAGDAVLTVDYRRRAHLGAAFATRIEPLGLKLEAGYSPGANAMLMTPGAGPLLAAPASLPQLGVTASLDYDRGSELTVVVEASHVRVFDVPAGMSVFQMDGDQLLLTGARVQWAPRGLPLSLHLLSFVDVTSPSYAVRPALRLSGHDNLSVEVGAGIYGGPAGSWGGSADRNDEFIVTLQYGL